MAKQTGIFTLKGTMSGVTFYHTTLDGHLAHQKSSLSKERVMTDDAFIRTRENGVEFGGACVAGHTLRQGLRTFLRAGKDRRVTSRLVKNMMNVVHSDTTSIRGARVAELGDSTLLNGFDFNKNAKLSEVFTAPFASTIDRVAGTLTMNIPSFIPLNMIVAPEGATHFKIVTEGAEVDYALRQSIVEDQETAILPFDSTPTSIINQVATVTAGSTFPLFHMLGIQFLEIINGSYYDLRNNGFNSLRVVYVDQP
jgi:hypothetical protein